MMPMSTEILAHLSQSDAVLAGVIRAVGPYHLEMLSDCHPFEALAQAIAHQQLNGTAANTILRRLIDSCGGGTFPSAQTVLDVPAATLRAAGFSFAKVAALKDLAAKTLAEVVPDGATLGQLGDDEIVGRLTEVRGIGRWTVEMLLIFRLGRPDVLPVDDFGLRSGFQAAYGLRRLPEPRALAAWGERWRPYRTAAAWYLWRALELKRTGVLPAPAERIRLPRVKKRRGTKVRKSARRRRVKKAASGTLKRGGVSSARLRRSGERNRAHRRRGSQSRARASKK